MLNDNERAKRAQTLMLSFKIFAKSSQHKFLQQYERLGFLIYCRSLFNSRL